MTRRKKRRNSKDEGSVLIQDERDIQARYRLVEALSAAERRSHELARRLEARVAELLAMTKQLDETNRHLHRLAHFDSLTGLPNRTLLEDRFEMALARASRQDILLGVLYIDLDDFKPINDTLGHDAGDRVLRGTADRIRSLLRESDTVAGVGGDEFVVLLEDVDGACAAEAIAQKLLHAIAEPYEDDRRALSCSASVGIALFPEDGRSSRELLRHADLAMLEAKRSRGYAGPPAASHPLERSSLPATTATD